MAIVLISDQMMQGAVPLGVHVLIAAGLILTGMCMGGCAGAWHDR
jgi:hypothetical protein